MCGGGKEDFENAEKARLEEFNKELDENKKQLQKGPIANRNTTDWCCCLIFLAFIVGFCGASAYGW